jgi:hypothetical protein
MLLKVREEDGEVTPEGSVFILEDRHRIGEIDGTTQTGRYAL